MAGYDAWGYPIDPNVMYDMYGYPMGPMPQDMPQGMPEPAPGMAVDATQQGPHARDGTPTPEAGSDGCAPPSNCHI